MDARPLANPFAILGVPHDADRDRVRRAYRALALRFHPDRSPDDPEAAERFVEVSRAFAQIEPEIEQQGDIAFVEQVSIEIDAALARAGGPAHAEIGLEDDCPTCLGVGSAGGEPARPCRDCDGTGWMGATDDVTGQHCFGCGGEGIVIDAPCTACSGAGTTWQVITLAVEIPADSATGDVIRARHPVSDRPLALEVVVAGPDLFRDEGAHVVLEMPVSFSEAGLGRTLAVPTPDGATEVTIPAGCRDGDLLPVGCTMGGRDLMLRVRVIPPTLTDEVRQALATLAVVEGDALRAAWDDLPADYLM